MQSRVRIAGWSGDAQAIARIHVDSWQATYGNGLLPRQYLDRLTIAGLTERWQKRLGQLSRGSPATPAHIADAYSVWVAEIGDEVVGFAEFGPCTQDPALAGFAGEVYMLYVHPSAQGRGIGRDLLDCAVAELAAYSFYWLVIWVVAGNQRAQAFYRRAGLKSDGARRIDHFAGQSVPVVRYARPLNPIIDFDRLFERV